MNTSRHDFNKIVPDRQSFELDSRDRQGFAR